jgi:hypothetical protein
LLRNNRIPYDNDLESTSTNSQRRRIEINLSYLEAWEIHSQASTRAPSVEELNPAGMTSREKGVLVNTPTLSWVYTRTFKERGRRDP